ncbi:MAG: response regulator [Desulfobulbaceae bacterium]|nr:response regulator [Desulfobulbaceae bacterium]
MSHETPILIIDDSNSMRIAIRQMLMEEGYREILMAQDGREGMKCLKESMGACGKRIGLILCDWTMPNMSGIELLTATKKIDELKGIPFVMVTNEKRTDRILQAVQAGAVDFIVKPFPPALLLEKVKKHLVVRR